MSVSAYEVVSIAISKSHLVSLPLSKVRTPACTVGPLPMPVAADTEHW